MAATGNLHAFAFGNHTILRSHTPRRTAASTHQRSSQPKSAPSKKSQLPYRRRLQAHSGLENDDEDQPVINDINRPEHGRLKHSGDASSTSSTSDLPSQIGQPLASQTSVLGATFLTAGTCVGAGILALPAVTWEAGFLPSTTMLVASWLFMVTTGLLLAEVALFTMSVSGRSQVSMKSMSELTLGKQGAAISSVTYLFLHYTLLVAYISQFGHVLVEPFHLPDWMGSLAFTASFGSFLYFAPPDKAEKVNNTLVFVLMASFLLLLSFASQEFHPEFLTHVSWPHIVPAIPTIFLSLVYHNVVPLICAQLRGNVDQIRFAIMAGTAIPLLMFALWNSVILGNISNETLETTKSALLDTTQTLDPLQMIRQAGDSLGGSISIFTLLAISTSFIGFVYGLTDFFLDGGSTLSKVNQGDDSQTQISMNFLLGPLKNTLTHRWSVFALTLVPPLIFANTISDVFFSALHLGGSFGVSTLFGIIPAVMAWKARSLAARLSTDNDTEETRRHVEQIPGGSFTLAIITIIAGSIILQSAVELAM